MELTEFYAMDVGARAEALRHCCGSASWVSGMLRQPPAGAITDLLDQAEYVWNLCGTEDWLEAFSHHPKIGDIESLRAKFTSTAHLASAEQSGVKQASSETIHALTDGNAQYEERFGFIFIVCATGKSAEEMLCMLQDRLTNTKEQELRIAANEQLKITKLRLEKLFQS